MNKKIIFILVCFIAVASFATTVIVERTGKRSMPKPHTLKTYSLGFETIKDGGVLILTMEGVEFQRVPLKEICR